MNSLVCSTAKTMIKCRFINEYGNCRLPADGRRDRYSLENIQGKNPVVFCVDCIYKQENRSKETHCDHFMFYDVAHAISGICIIEIKEGKYPKKEKVKKQLTAGAEFVAGKLAEREGFSFTPILVAKWTRPRVIGKIRETTIALRRQKKKIVYIPIENPPRTIDGLSENG